MKSKKVLYALQGTGNGHVSRAREILPVLQKHCTVDVWLSGNQTDIELPIKPKYISKGIVMFYTKNGAVSYWKTFWQNNFIKAVIEIFSAPVKEYDFVINDFEFITYRACLLRKKRCVQLSHQAAFKWIDSPRPKSKSLLGEAVLKYYSGGGESYGFHFFDYHENIYPPVIRSEVRLAKNVNNGHYTVYLPAFHHDQIIDFLNAFYKVKWHVFSKYVTSDEQFHNITVKPINNESFVDSFVTCTGLLCSAGFEAPAEALYLGKKLAVIPIKNQYEQLCNAAALRMEGVLVLDKLNRAAKLHISKWLNAPLPKPHQFPNYIENLLLKII